MFLTTHTWAQDVPTRMEEKLENLADVTENDLEDDTYLQQLDYFHKHPLNINTATAEDLQVFRVLTGLQVQNLIRYRQLLGNLVSLYELQAVPAWDIATVRRMLPYITIADPLIDKKFSRRLKEGEHYLLIRDARVLEKSKGYNSTLPSHYPGSPDHLLVRYRYQYKNLMQWGVTAEKDAGEQFFRNTQSRGFDFYSGHLFVRRLGVVSALAVGDFTVNIGQGLVHWQTLAFKKNADVLGIKRQAAVLRPYSGAGEFFFNRGTGITLKLKKIEATAFASFRKVSGNIVLDTFNNEELFSSLQSSGLHRTPGELRDRNRIQQTTYGGVVSYQVAGFKIAVNAVQYHFSKVYQKQNQPYNRFAISGREWHNYSADYSFTYRNVHLFGEAAVDKQWDKALVQGALVSVDPKVDIALLYRNISKAYQSLYGNAFTENVLPTNEQGLYAGIRLRPMPGWQVDAYADFYCFPFLKYRVDAPSSGADYLAQITFQPNKRLEVYARYRYETKQMNESDVTTPLNYLVYKPRQNWRLNEIYNVTPVFTLKSRVEMMWYDREGKNPGKGFLAYLQSDIKPTMALNGNIRLQYFHTDGYNSRIYTYENDMLFSYSIPAFFNHGFRYYFNVSYDAFKHFSFWLRWAQTIYTDQSIIGSGLDAISGNKKTEIKAQMRYTF
ncbi:MAG: helix-hairpin-helix domain-containing protein [Flavisolibacter sp.]|nr:helix-hairpin-helix domain-containing protein [Flavisolibacter sp.]